MTERRGYYDVALYFPEHLKLWELYDVLERLSDHGIDVDYATLEFTPEGLFCDAKTYNENVEEIIKDIGNGDVFLDWDTMGTWEPMEGDE